MTLHKDKVVSLLSRSIQTVLNRGLNDPRVRGMMTVTQVRVSEDLASGTVMVSVLPAEHAELTVHGLQHAAQHIRTEVGKIVRMRRMPRLTFKVDESLKKQASIVTAINTAIRVDDERRANRESVDTTEEVEP